MIYFVVSLLYRKADSIPAGMPEDEERRKNVKRRKNVERRPARPDTGMRGRD